MKSLIKPAEPFDAPIKTREKLFGILYIFIHSYLLPNFYSFLFMHFGGEMPLSPAQFTLLCYLTGFVMVLIFMNGFLRRSFSDFFDKPLRCLSTAGLGLGLYYASAIVVSIIVIVTMPNPINPGTEDVIKVVQQDSRLTFAAAVLLAPIVEEAMFRGALFGAIRPKSRVLAYVVTMLLFALYHLWSYFIADFHWIDLVYLLQYCPMGIILAWCYERSGSIWTPILLHAAVNAIAVNVQKMM